MSYYVACCHVELIEHAYFSITGGTGQPASAKLVFLLDVFPIQCVSMASADVADASV